MNTEHGGWMPQVGEQPGPIYLAIADAISDAVSTGKLRPGDRLPTHRAMAETLGVDLTTVTRAYAEARKRGVLEATVGRGTFVRTEKKRSASSRGESQGSGALDLSMNLPPQPEPPLIEALQRGFSGLLVRPDISEFLTYRSASGMSEERTAGAAWLLPTVGEVDPERVLVSPGAQPALLAMLGMAAKPGEVVLTDGFTYPGIRGAAGQLGIRLAGVAADADGMLPDAIRDACRAEPGSKALYCIPTIQNPTTTTMPLARRKAIAEVARECGLCIIEDDAYGLLPAAPLPAIASLAPDITFHVATVSKVLSPALRVAFLVGPDQRQTARLNSVLRANVQMPSPLLTGLTASWVRDGTASAVVQAIRRECAARQKIARQILPTGSFDAHLAGLHVWLRLPERWSSLGFTARLRRQDGLAVVPSDVFAVAGAVPSAEKIDAVRISLGAAPDRDRLRQALGIVAEALKEDASAIFPEVV